MRAGHRRLSRLRVAIAVAWLALGWSAGRAESIDALTLVDRLGSMDRAAVERAIRDIEAAPIATPYLADALFAAGRTCEDTLADPVRALALYDRIQRDLPDAGVVIAARRRAAALRVQVGASGEHAREAAAYAALVADADRLVADEVERRAEQLAAAPWPGAPEVAVWHAQWLRRSGRLADAQRRYAEVVERWADTPHAIVALRDGAGNALAAGDWALADRLARQLPAAAPSDQILRDELLDAAARGQRRDRWYVVAWLVVGGAGVALGGSLAEAALRRPRRRPRIPIEVAFLAPVAAVLVGVALTTHETIAPAVITLSIGGVVIAGLSGATLELVRAAGRPVRLRAVAHVAVCLLAIAALAYIVLMRDNLLDMLVETVRFGPE